MRTAYALAPLLLAPLSLPITAKAQAQEKGMSVSQLVDVATFTDLGGDRQQALLSPNGKYLVAVVERPASGGKQLRAEILLWTVATLEAAIRAGTSAPPPKSLAMFLAEDGPIVSRAVWSDDSGSVLVLANAADDHSGLWRVPVMGGKKQMSAPGQNVRIFDQAGSTLLYSADADPVERLSNQKAAEDAMPSVVATGKSLQELLFPEDRANIPDWVTLWANSGDITRQIFVNGNGRISEDRGLLKLSPNGRQAVLDLPVESVPEQWSALASGTSYDMLGSWKTGKQYLGDKNALVPHQFVLLDLITGRAEPLVAAPDAKSRGFLLSSMSMAAWSRDGAHLALSGSFVPGHDRPCFVVVDVRERHADCIRTAADSLQNDRPAGIAFAGGQGDELTLDLASADGPTMQWDYSLDRASGKWKETGHRTTAASGEQRYFVSQDINTPPALARRGSGDEIVRFFDPNPQIAAQNLGLWKVISIPIPGSAPLAAGLLLPDTPPPPGGYPLVIQTHGFNPAVFAPSGSFEAPFAAQAFLKAGMAVVQLPDCPSGTGEAETNCALTSYQYTISYLEKNDHIDPDKVGIVGFSRTCIFVMDAMVDPRFHFRAAILQDGFLNTFSQYFNEVDYFGGFVTGWMRDMIGGHPYGDGLAEWRKHSPSFHYDKLDTPLRIEANGREGVLLMWEPYAAMRDRQKPVELIVTHKGTHPLSNPAARIASQKGAVEWFKRWLSK